MPFIVPPKYVRLTAVLSGLSPAVLNELEQFVAEIKMQASAKIGLIKQILAVGEGAPRSTAPWPTIDSVSTKAPKPAKKAVKKAEGKKSRPNLDSVEGKLLLLEIMAKADTKDEAHVETAKIFGLTGPNRNQILSARLRRVLYDESRPGFLKEVLNGLPDKQAQDHMLGRLSGWYTAIFPYEDMSPERLLKEAKKVGYELKKK